ncbi:unnamed protein product [marine sediment metagenome]|uniref:Uncharacterized protein n=1 Tax=marine sediment metagenome TaxID=412755 RepID=X1SMN4_9ZZZZ
MSVKAIQALMTGLVVLACVVGGIILIIRGIDHTVGVILLIIVGSYLGLDLTPWVPLGKIQKRKGGGDAES